MKASDLIPQGKFLLVFVKEDDVEIGGEDVIIEATVVAIGGTVVANLKFGDRLLVALDHAKLLPQLESSERGTHWMISQNDVLAAFR